MLQPHTTSNSLQARDNIHISCLWVKANSQLAINPKDGKIHPKDGKMHKSHKAMMDLSRNPREGIFPSLGLIVLAAWLLAVAHKQVIY